jgi:hypothetical protein
LVFAEFTDPVLQLRLTVTPGCSELRQIRFVAWENYGRYQAGYFHARRGTHEHDEKITFDAMNEGHAITSPHVLLHLRQDAALGSYDVVEHLKRRPRTRFATEAKLSRIPRSQIT